MIRERVSEILKNTQFRLIVIIILLLFIPGLITLRMGFQKSETMLMEKTSRLISENLKNKENRIIDMTYAARKLSSITSTNKEITSMLIDLTKNPRQKSKSINLYTLNDWEKVNIMQNILDNYRNTFFDYQVHNLLIGSDGTTYVILDGINDTIRFRSNFVNSLNKQSWYIDFLSSDKESIWVTPCRYDTSGNFEGDFGNSLDSKNYIVFARKIHDYVTQQDLGISIVSLYADNVKNILTADENCVMALVNKEGQLIVSTDVMNGDTSKSIISYELAAGLPNNKSGYINTSIENENYMVNYLEMESTGWKLVYALPENRVVPEITELRNYTYSISMTIFVMALVICISLIVYTTNPMRRMIERVKKIRIGEHVVGQEGFMNDDLGNVEATFDFMVNRIEELVNTVLKKQQLESQLKYETLRAQINPHFLFNTLNSIKWSAMICGAGNIAEMISCLGELLEASTQRGDDMITLKKELDLVKSYSSIKSWTTKYRFELVFDVEEELYDFKILKFSLQPIVENAIIHGMEGMENGLIRIKAYHEENDVYISIIDNGQGMDESKVAELLSEKEENKEKQRFSGIGLKSIDGIIRLKYGSQYGIIIETHKMKGTNVTLHLPYKV